MIYEINDILHTKFKAQGFNAITFGDVSEVDLQKQSILPLAHIVLDSIENLPASVNVNYTGVVVDSIDSNNLDPRTTLNKFSRTDNLEDVFHDLAFRLRRVFLSIQKDVDTNISLVGLPTFEALYDEGLNDFAGYRWTAVFNIRGANVC